jgi:Fic family protein
LERALIAAEATLQVVLFKSSFWKQHAETTVSERQKKVLNRLLDAGKNGFEGGLSTRKYMGIAKVSRATAWREIGDLLQKQILQPLPGKGRGTAYEIAWNSKGNSYITLTVRPGE